MVGRRAEGREREGEGQTGTETDRQRGETERDRRRDGPVGQLLPDAGGTSAALARREQSPPLGEGALRPLHNK